MSELPGQLPGQLADELANELTAQMPLPLPHETARGRSDFLVSQNNRAALGWIERWPDWPGGGLALHGPAQCGKTHLLHLWRARSAGRLLDGGALAGEELAGFDGAGPPAVAVDDAERAPERALLHLYNSCRERGGSVLIAARHPPARWPTALADLASRLRALPVAAIEPPDEALLAGILIKHFADRQVPVAPEVIAYLVCRIERSFAAAAAVAARLDSLSLGARRPVTVPLVRRVLAAAPAQSSRPPSDVAVT